MARYAVIENGEVTNIARSVSKWDDSWRLLTNAQDVRIGDLWDGTNYTRPDPVPVVPQAVTRRQAKQALFLAGRLADVEAALNALPSPDKEIALIYWEEAGTFDRNHPLIEQIGAALGLDVDALFITAEALP